MLVQALQCLVNILRSLVEWYTAGMPTEQPELRVSSQQSVVEENVQSWESLTSTAPSQLFSEPQADDGVEPGSPLRPTLRRDTSVLQSMMMSTGNLVSRLPVLPTCHAPTKQPEPASAASCQEARAGFRDRFLLQ